MIYLLMSRNYNISKCKGSQDEFMQFKIKFYTAKIEVIVIFEAQI